MSKSRVWPVLGFIVLSSVLFSASVQAQSPTPAVGTFVVDAAEDFIRSNGAPVTLTRTFTVLDPTASYKLHLYNGGRNTQFTMISSVTINLNGREIVGTLDLNTTVAFLERDVPLLANNTFTVELRSQPGSGITIEFIGIDNDPPTIAASVNPLPNTSGWNNANVTVSFTCSDAISGVASCPEPVVI